MATMATIALFAAVDAEHQKKVRNSFCPFSRMTFESLFLNLPVCPLSLSLSPTCPRSTDDDNRVNERAANLGNKKFAAGEDKVLLRLEHRQLSLCLAFLSACYEIREDVEENISLLTIHTS